MCHLLAVRKLENGDSKEHQVLGRLKLHMSTSGLFWTCDCGSVCLLMGSCEVKWKSPGLGFENSRDSARRKVAFRKYGCVG